MSHIDEVEVETESNDSVDKDGEENDLSLTVRDEVPEAIASGFVDEERSKTTYIIPPRRSSRVREKPKWQKSGDYCMGISKQVMMLQTLLRSSVVKTLDPTDITAITKGISDSL